MKILWLTPQFPTNNKSIKGIYLYRTVRYLSKFFDIETWCFYPKVPPIFNMLKNPHKATDTYNYWKSNNPTEAENLIGIQKGKINYITYYRLPRTIFHFLEAYFILCFARKKINKLGKEFIIYSNWIFPAGHVAYLLSKKFQIPYSVSLLGTDVHKLKYGTIYWKFAKKILENASYVTSVSEELIKRCKESRINISNEKMILVDNIYDIVNFKILSKTEVIKNYNFDARKKNILFVGGLVEIKNVNLLIEAFNKINNSQYNLIIAGKGPEESNLKKLASKSNYSKNITFVGNLQGNELVNYYNLADVFCLPSKNEGTPNVVIEALLCGVPVVASNVGGLPNLINENINGFLVEKNKSDLLAQTLIKASSLKWDRKVLRDSMSKYFPENALKKYSDVFSKLERVKI